MAVFSKQLNHLDVNDVSGSLRQLENHISYMQECLEFNNSNLTKSLSASGTSSAEMVLVVAALKNSVSALTSSVDKLNGEVSALQTTVSSLQSGMDAANSSITEIKGSIESLDSRVKALESKSTGGTTA